MDKLPKKLKWLKKIVWDKSERKKNLKIKIIQNLKFEIMKEINPFIYYHKVK